MKVTVDRVVSSLPSVQALTEQVVREALSIVAARLAAAGYGRRHLDVSTLEVDMPGTPDRLATSADRARAARVLAGRLIAQLAPTLGFHGAPDLELEARAATGAPAGSVQAALVQAKLSPVAYGPSVKVLRGGPAARAPRMGGGGLGRIKAFLGLGGGKLQVVRPEDTPALRADNEAFVSDFLAVEARMRQYGTLSGEDFGRLRDGLGPHLTRLGVAHKQQGAEFDIVPASRGSQLNVLAWSARKKLGITISYDLRDRLKPGAAVGAFSSDARHLKLDTRSVLAGRPSGTALHELHHAFLYRRIERGSDSFVNLKMWSMSRDEDLSSARMYTRFMSNQELATFSKQPRQVVGLHLREGAVYTQALDRDLRTYVWKLSQVALQGKEVAEKVIPELETFVATGQSSAVQFGVAKDGDLEVKLLSGKKGLHHRIALHTLSAEHRKAGVSNPARQKLLAQDLLLKMQLTLKVSELLLLQSHVVTRELEHLTIGQPLLPEEVRALQNLTAWFGYSVRVGTSANTSLEEKLAELTRQRGLAESRLGGGVSTLPALDLTVDDV